MVAYVARHEVASYSLPLPWPDEAHFIWQANGFAEHFSLFAEELNPDRTILWMPPGYFVVLGIVIRLCGLSIDVARGFSLALMLGAIVTLALLVRRYRLPVPSLALAVPFVLGAPFVAAGNVARMEALLIFMVLMAFLLLQRGKILLGLGLLALTPLVHPNGLYFLVSGMMAGILMIPRPWTWRRPTAAESVCLGAVALCWIGYGLHAWMHWTDFVHDMTFQFERKEARNIKDAILTPGSVFLFATVLGGAAYCLYKKLPVILLLAIAAPAWWVAAAGIEMWYRVFFALSYLLITIMFLVVVAHLWRSGATRWKTIAGSVLVSAIAGGAIGWNAMTSSFGEPLIFPDPNPWYHMPADAGPYITAADLTKIQTAIDLIAEERDSSTVEFYPAADAFFFTSDSPPQIRFSYPLFCTRPPNWYVVHVSSLFTPVFHRYALALLDAAQVKPEELRSYLIQASGAGDQWFLIPGEGRVEFRKKL